MRRTLRPGIPEKRSFAHGSVPIGKEDFYGTGSELFSPGRACPAGAAGRIRKGGLSQISHGRVEWTKYNKDFIFRYFANGNEKYATAITNVLNALKDYLHLNVNPNK